MKRIMNNTIRKRVYKAKASSISGAFLDKETGRGYSRLWPKYKSKLEFSSEWCLDAQLAIQEENSRLYKETGRCSWTSGDYVSMPSKYYVAEFNEHAGY